MRIPKKYGAYREDNCIFCGKRATTKNSQGITVCIEHKDAILNDMKCACGKYLDIKQSKYGFFFLCEKCGCISPKKAFENNKIEDVGSVRKQELRANPNAYRPKDYRSVSDFNHFMKTQLGNKKTDCEKDKNCVDKISFDNIKKDTNTSSELNFEKSSFSSISNNNFESDFFSEIMREVEQNKIQDESTLSCKSKKVVPESELKNLNGDQLDEFIVSLDDLEDFNEKKVSSENKKEKLFQNEFII
jgi:hypothetical protein